jgi:molybdopterin-guanine dinucleotide biosynthesis protein A
MKHNVENVRTSIPVVILAGGQSNRLRVGNKLKWQLPFHNSYHSSYQNRHLFDANKLSDDSFASTSSHLQHAKDDEHNQTLLAFIIDRLKLQSDCIIINGPCTENTALNQYQLPVISDLLADFQGPLSGILTALHWAKEHKQQWVATVSCDTPFFPEDFLHILSKDIMGGDNDNEKAAIAVYKERSHPTFGLWSVELYESLKHAIEVDKIRAVNRWALAHAKEIDFGASAELGASAKLNASAELKALPKNTKHIDPFFNINTLQDYKEALSYLI